jgi:hypothetical protein
MKRFAGVCLLVATTLALSAWVGTGWASAGIRSSATGPHFRESRPPRISSSSRLILHGRVRCTATAKGVVQAGHAASIKMVLRNVSKRSVKVFIWVNIGAVVKAADGTTYDTEAYLNGLPGIPPPIPSELRRGATKRLRPVGIPVRWAGPLQITPDCLGIALPVLHVRVASPGPPSDESAAVDEVVAASGHLLDQCRPQTPGFPVTGQIDPPSGSYPPMDAQCSVSFSSEGRFWVGQVLVLIPPGLSGVQLFEPYELLWPLGHFDGLASTPPYEAIAWEFVVTKNKALPVAASSLRAANSSSQVAPTFDWRGSGWHLDGSGTCGGTGFAFGGVGPSIEFISVCS